MLILITGTPGCGKTTLCKRVLKEIQARIKSSRVRGFLSEERRATDRSSSLRPGRREGFDLVDISSGRRARLATIENSLLPADLQQKARMPRVGRYLVHLAEFEHFICGPGGVLEKTFSELGLNDEKTTEIAVSPNGNTPAAQKDGNCNKPASSNAETEKSVSGHDTCESSAQCLREDSTVQHQKSQCIETTQSFPSCVFVDEIGRMELYSAKFVRDISKLLDRASEREKIVVIMTVALKGSGFIAQVKQRSDIAMFLELNHKNRDKAVTDVVNLILG